MTSQWSQCGSQSNVLVTPGVAKSWNSAASRVLSYTMSKFATGSRYGAFVLARLRAGNASDLQTYACRSVRGGNEHSEHAHACAFDDRPWANPLSDSGFLITDFDMFGSADGEAFLHSIGDPVPGVGPLWQWGGALYSNDINTWLACYRRRGQRITSGRVDAMHFEVDNAIMPSDAARLPLFAEEDDLTPEDKAWIKAQFDGLENQIGSLTKNVRDLQVTDERTTLLYDGMRDGDLGKIASDKDPALKRIGIRLVNAAEKILGKADPPPKP